VSGPLARDVAREHGLARQLSAGQQSMMALGGVIANARWLARAQAVTVGGPAVGVS
jgi:amino acid permease